MDQKKIDEVLQKLWNFYAAHGRHDLPWRQPERDGSFDPYKIVVSELMLQQTQVPRVTPKFTAFIQMFPTFEALAAASLAEVLCMWSGLGYNRRAKFLWQTAQAVMHEHNGQLPQAREVLVRLPGIGSNTAGAIAAYAFDQPAVFVETNVRTVFIHHFFADELTVSDAALTPVIEVMLAKAIEPRTFYWALMDYGTHLKQTIGNTARLSSGYAKQSSFAGSRRQVRGQVLRLLTIQPNAAKTLEQTIQDERLHGVLDDLLREGMVETNTRGEYQLPAA